MGRTNPTYRDALEGIAGRWRDYRRGLRRRDEPHFDRLFEHARRYADAGGHLNHEDPRWPMLVSVALAQEAHIAALEDRIDDLEARVERSDAADDGPERDSPTTDDSPGRR